MDFNKLAKVTDSINGGKQNVTVEGRSVTTEENPLNALSITDRISDSRKAIIIDDAFISKLRKAPRLYKRRFLSRLSDSQRRRVLTLLNKKINDSGFSERLGYVLLDDLLANVIADPIENNISSLKDFVKSQNYLELSDNIKELIEQVENAETDLNQEALQELEEGLDGRPSRVIEVSGINAAYNDDFELPEEEDLTDDDIESLSDAAEKHIAQFLKDKNLKAVIDAADDIISEFQGKHRRYSDTSTVYWKAFSDAWNSQFGDDTKVEDSVKKVDKLLALIKDDDALDEFFEKKAVDEDGNVVHDTEEEPIIELFTEALTSYMEGDTSKLDALAKQTIEGETPAEETTEEDPVEEPDDEPEPSEEDDVKDSLIHFARRLLANKSVNKLTDSLSSKVSILTKYNLKKSDCTAPYCELPEQAPNTINLPLTRQEYCTMFPAKVPCIMQDLIEANDYPQVPYINSYELAGNCIDINNGQLYYPYNCTSEELYNRLKEASEDESLQQIVGSCAIPLEDAMHLAAQCDALNLVDSRFYKSSITDSSWSFDADNVPDVVKDKGFKKVQRSSKDNADLMIYGVPFKGVD